MAAVLVEETEPGGDQRVVGRAVPVPGVGAVSTVYNGEFELRGSLSNVTAVSTDHRLMVFSPFR